MVKLSSWFRWCPNGCGKSVEYRVMSSPIEERAKHRLNVWVARVWECSRCGQWFSKKELVESNGDNPRAEVMQTPPEE